MTNYTTSTSVSFKRYKKKAKIKTVFEKTSPDNLNTKKTSGNSWKPFDLRKKFQTQCSGARITSRYPLHCPDQCFLTGRMVQPRAKENFARVNERSGVNEGWMKFLLLIFRVLWWHAFVLSIYPTHGSNHEKMANFKRANFASSTVSNLTLQKNCTMVQLSACITRPVT